MGLVSRAIGAAGRLAVPWTWRESDWSQTVALPNLRGAEGTPLGGGRAAPARG